MRAPLASNGRNGGGSDTIDRVFLDIVRHEGVGVTADPGQVIYREGCPNERLVIIEEGWVSLFRSCVSGERQNLDFALPERVLLPSPDPERLARWSAEWLTRGRATVISVHALERLMTSSAPFAEWIGTLRAGELDRAYENLMNLGRRSGLERVAFLLSKLHFESTSVNGFDPSDECEIPIRQQDLADALGFTTVYVNQMIKRLKGECAISLRNRKLVVTDAGRLYTLGEFEP